MTKLFTNWFKQHKYYLLVNYAKEYHQFNHKLLFPLLITITLITWKIFNLIYGKYDYATDLFYKTNSLENKIHIVILFDGDHGLQYLNSLMKSIFYHQNGRFRCDLKNCCVSNFCDRFNENFQHNITNLLSPSYTTVFHFLITTMSSNSALIDLMNSWKVHNMEYYFYSCKDHLENLQWIKSTHYSGCKPFLKLMLTEILPTHISKVIILDIDMLLNTDIIELWNHFENFNDTQSIGIGLEQNVYFQTVMQTLESNWEGYGYNNGVMLFDLSKLRQTSWNKIWISLTRDALDKQGTLITGEQDILNLVLFNYKYILYEIPCEWNIQLSEGSDHNRCPVSWLTYSELKKRNFSTLFKQPKLIHINHSRKPNDVIWENVSSEHIDQSDTILEQLDLYTKFISVYRQYTSLHESCFN
ncbi:unnamed protein product [Schistosoma turkestanicum]|nr:unnamed protein product [Schistosoma turkestanicum]